MLPLVPTPDELKADIESMMHQVAENIVKLNSAASGLRNAGLRFSSKFQTPYARLVFEDCLKALIDDHSKRLIKEYSSGISIELEVPSKYYAFGICDFKYEPYSVDDLSESIELALSRIKYEEIAGFWCAQSIELRSTVRRKMASTIVSNFGLSSEFRTKRGGISFTKTRSESLGQGDVNKILPDDLSISLRALDSECDVDLRKTLVEACGHIEPMVWNQAFESGTSFGKNTDLEVVYFNKSTRFTFTKASFSALTAFILINSDNPAVKENLMKASQSIV